MRLASVVRRRRFTKAFFVVVWPIAAASCALASRRQSPVDPDRSAGSSGYVITTAELKHFDRATSVLEAIQHSRPWLLERESISAVSIDFSPLTDLAVLRTTKVVDVKEIWLLQAVPRIGDVILVLRSGGR